MLRFRLAHTFELVALSDIFIVIVGLLVPTLLKVGKSPWQVLYFVVVFSLVEEILINSFLVPYGLILAFIGLVGFPALGAVVRKKDLRVVLEISGLIFVTRIALAPFPIKVLELAVSLPAIYTVIMSVIVFYVLFRKIPLSKIKITRGTIKMPFQILLGALGLPLGLIEYEILKPKPLSIGPNPVLNEVYIVLTMILFVGVTEELLFRGLLLNYLNNLMPNWLGVHLSSLVFSLFHIGYLNPIEVLFAYSAGVLFAFLVMKTGSLTSSILAHGIGNIVLFTLASTMPH